MRPFYLVVCQGGGYGRQRELAVMGDGGRGVKVASQATGSARRAGYALRRGGAHCLLVYSG